MARDKDPFVRERVAAALGELPPEATLDVTILLKLLRDGDQRVREQAVVALSKRGRSAVKPLLEVLTLTDVHLPLTHKSKELHMAAEASCYQPTLCYADYAAVALCMMDDDVSDLIEEHVAALLKSAPNSFPVKDLLSGDRPDKFPYKSLSTTPEVFALRYCAMLLRRSKARAGTFFKEWLGSDEARYQAFALSIFNDNDLREPSVVAPRVAEILKTGIDAVRPDAASLLALMGDEGHRYLAECLTSANPLVKLAAARAEDSVLAVPALLALIENPSAEIRRSALDKLGDLLIAKVDKKSAEDRALLNRIARVLESHDRETRNEASAILRNLVTNQSSFLTTALVKRLGSETDPEIQDNLIDALVTIGDAQAGVIQVLEEIIRREEKEVAPSAIRALAKLGATDRCASALFAILRGRLGTVIWEQAAAALLASDVHGRTAAKIIAASIKRNAALAAHVRNVKLSDGAIREVIQDAETSDAVRHWAEVLARNTTDERFLAAFRKLKGQGNPNLHGLPDTLVKDSAKPKAIPSVEVFASLNAKEKCSALFNHSRDISEDLALAALSDKDPVVRKAGEDAAAKIQKPSDRLKAVFAKTLEDPDTNVRHEALSVLNPFWPQETIPLLTPEIVAKVIALMRDPKRSLEEKRSAVATLSHARSSAGLVLPALARLLMEDRRLQIPILQGRSVRLGLTRKSRRQPSERVLTTPTKMCGWPQQKPARTFFHRRRRRRHQPLP